MAKLRINPHQPTGIIVHGLHKSGTMFLYQLFRRLSRMRGIKYYSPNNIVPNDQFVSPDIDHDFCLCPIRTFTGGGYEFEKNQRIKRIFHIRDPRDILVSQYYSYGFSHSDKNFDLGRRQQRDSILGQTIDEYVLDEKRVIKSIKRKLNKLTQRDPMQLQTVVKYEDMVANFPFWLAQVINAFAFRFPKLATTRFTIRYRGEFRADNSPTAHKRAVLPGDHLRRLQPASIKKLNEMLEPELLALNYPLSLRSQAKRAA